MSQFWSSTKLRLRVESSDGHEQFVDLDRPYAILGSGRECDVQVASVAKQAILVFEIDGVVRALVLAGRSRHAGRSLRVIPAHPIQLGDHRISIVSDDPPTPTPQAQPAEDSRRTVFAVTWNPGDCRQFLLLGEAKPILIGRKSPCQIQIPDQRLSGRHAVIFRHQERLWVVDLHSANGTTVGSLPITCTSLAFEKSFVLGASQRIHFVRFHTDEVVQTHIRMQEQQRSQLEESKIEFHAASLRLAKLAEEASEFFAVRSSLESQVDQSNRNVQRLVADLEQRERELEELAQRESTQIAATKRVEHQLVEANQAIEELRVSREQLQEQMHNLQQELANARELVSSDAIRQRESELESLQEELKAEREILKHLQLQSTTDDETSVVSEDETCISSFDFQDMLEEAWEGLPAVDDE